MTRILIALLAARVVTSLTGGAASIRPHRSELAAAKKQFPFVLDICSGKLQQVLAKYNKRTKKYKKAYTAEIKKRDDFSTLGYIYSDWAKDGFDGKQLTVTTYI